MGIRVDRAQVLDHLHLQGVVAQCDGIVLGLDEVHADIAGIDGAIKTSASTIRTGSCVRLM
jgi:hypothetical protein